jgi:hypothetical protein
MLEDTNVNSCYKMEPSRVILMTNGFLMQTNPIWDSAASGLSFSETTYTMANVLCLTSEQMDVCQYAKKNKLTIKYTRCSYNETQGPRFLICYSKDFFC